jgi:hypothetical protein
MAKRETINLIIKTFRELGGNVSDVLGTRTNVNFLGVGDNVEPFLDKNLNTEALGALSQSKAIDEAKNAVGFAVGDKLNDIQANNLLTNLNKMKEFYMPPAGPANIIDLGTQTGVERTITRNLDAEGLGALRKGGFDDIDPNSEIAASLRLEEKGKKLADSMSDAEIELRGNFPTASDDQIKQMLKTGLNIDDLPPPGSRGGADDIAAPVEQGFAGFERTIRELAKSDPELAKQFRTVMTNKGDMPGKRASAREFLVEALKKDEMDVGTAAFGKVNLNNVISAEDVRYITEGGGGLAGDPILIVEKYFGPRIAEALPVNASNEEILIFTKRVLEKVEDAAGLKPDNPRFDRFTARFIDEVQDFAKGGLAKILEV